MPVLPTPFQQNPNNTSHHILALEHVLRDPIMEPPQNTRSTVCIPPRRLPEHLGRPLEIAPTHGGSNDCLPRFDDDYLVVSKGNAAATAPSTSARSANISQAPPASVHPSPPSERVDVQCDSAQGVGHPATCCVSATGRVADGLASGRSDMSHRQGHHPHYPGFHVSVHNNENKTTTANRTSRSLRSPSLHTATFTASGHTSTPTPVSAGDAGILGAPSGHNSGSSNRTQLVAPQGTTSSSAQSLHMSFDKTWRGMGSVEGSGSGPYFPKPTSTCPETQEHRNVSCVLPGTCPDTSLVQVARDNSGSLRRNQPIGRGVISSRHAWQAELDDALHTASALSAFEDVVLARSWRPVVPLVRRQRRSVLPKGLENNLPLHAKRVVPISLDALAHNLPIAAWNRIQELLHALATTHPSPQALKTIPHRDLASLLASGVLENLRSPDLITSYVQYFSVLESLKQRRRPIFWPKCLLNQSLYSWPTDIPLGNVQTYRRLVLRGSHAVAFDLAASFWQIPLPDNVNLAVKAANGNTYRVARLPYGADVAPEIMQRLLVNVAPQVPGTTVMVHIDNVIAVGSFQQVTRWREQFLQRATQFGLTLNVEPANNPTQRLVFAGMELDLVHKTTRVNPAKPAPQFHAHSSYEELERVIGKLLYAAAVLNVDLVPFYYMLKWWRRHLSALGRGLCKWTTKPNIPAPTRIALGQLQGIIERNAPAPVTEALSQPQRLPTVVLCSDATLRGFGGVLMQRGHEPLAFGATFGVDPANICLAEATALLAAVLQFADDIKGQHLGILVDNTSVLHAMRRESPRDLAMGTITARIRTTLQALNCSVSVAHITSQLNPADAPSRFKQVDLQKVAALTHALWPTDTEDATTFFLPA